MSGPKSSQAIMRLMQLTSPSLPVGAFAYSQGLESAIEKGLVHDLDSTERWIKELMHYGLGRLDIPLFYRLYGAWQAGDGKALRALNTEILAQRETKELFDEDAHMGGSLLRLLADLEMSETEIWQRTEAVSFTTMFALAAVNWQIDMKDAATGLLWSWLENQVAAAIKLVPLGQTDGQRLIGRLLDTIPLTLADAEQLSDDEIGSSLPMLAILSAQHETQYSRLFRS